MVICLERGANLHMAQLMPLPLTVSCFSKIQIGFTFLVLAHPGSPGQRAVKRVCVCMQSNLRCRLTQVDLYNGRKTVVVVLFSQSMEVFFVLHFLVVGSLLSINLIHVSISHHILYA